ncbi:3-deoxy-manno-octulosonate cytidylyltransferase [Ostreibacterium oceani]|uniref:3-deoxy-manno-octulosonate cytidylyltransferase n=1 Tax=Ostreibacterium oceani TaxID=2654998 RepID=A0A6N7F1J8_9GAMM|nr:3-deoxy-manno-octulosonate cytidylyltransferase [Ostreibacterium oceani]MPV86668.1 3-deoxy-manno-octulosonate cytidylyltransferase [Ostreibacterium oceani]
MTFTVIIPARLQSTRLPEKLLQPIGDDILLAHTYRAAQKSQAKRIVIAADDERILRAAVACGAEAILTDKNHTSGTDRLAECVQRLSLKPDEIIVNLQGDEPFMLADYINLCAATLLHHTEAVVATLAVTLAPSMTASMLADPNAVKVVCNQRREAMYFSRAAIPFAREGAPFAREAELPTDSANLAACYLHHLGIYAYRASFLEQYQSLPESPLEQIEKLEQLRVLWHGYRIAVACVDKAPPKGIDTQADLDNARRYWAALGQT